MGLDVDSTEAEVALKSAVLDLNTAKLEYSLKKKEAKEHKEKPTPSFKATSPVVVGKMIYKKAVTAMDTVKLAVTMQEQRPLNCMKTFSPTKPGSLGRRSSRAK